MTAAVRPRRPVLRSVLFGVAIVLAIVALAAGGNIAAFFAAVAELRVRPHAPDMALVAAAALEVQIHLAASLTALAIGTVLMLGVKGTALHRVLGWGWVVAMAAAAVSSLFIRQVNHGAFSLIHLLAGWTIIGLPMAVYAARRHRVAQHRKAMTGMFVGGLLLAGLLAFLPGRLMWAVFF